VPTPARPAFPRLAALAILGLATASAASPTAATDSEYRPPVLIDAPVPAYPEAALRPERTLTATVPVRLDLDQHGVPRNVAVKRSDGALFDLPALDNARRWRFQPALRNGEPVPATVEATVVFAGSDLPAKRTLAVVPPQTARRLGPVAHQRSVRPQPSGSRAR